MKAYFVLPVLFALLTIVFSTNDLCRLEADFRPCTARNDSSPKDEQCIKLFYNGCEGAADKFETLEECMKKCVGKIW
ncbi:Kunitz/Bovine pancreatic trypsin inhibitor domain protein [Cooperia oncophora]